MCQGSAGKQRASCRKKRGMYGMKTHQTPVREEHGAPCSCNSCPQPEKQAADNSRRAKKGRDKAVPEGGEPARLKGNSGGNTKVSWCSLQSRGASVRCLCHQGAVFLSQLPSGAKLLNGDIFPGSTVKDIWYMMGKDNSPTAGNTAQIPSSEKGASGRQPRPIIVTHLISQNLDLQQPRKAGKIVS